MAKTTKAQHARQQAAIARRRKERQTKIIAGLIVLALIVSLVAATVNLTRENEEANTGGDDNNSASASTPCPPATGAPRTINFENPPAMCIDPAKTYIAEMDTTEGMVKVRLDTQRTPNTTNNFVFLSRFGYYDGTRIFRTDPSIDIIQGGGPHTQTNADPGPGYTIDDEGGSFTYTEGDLVMARTGAPNSASGQYFFATGPNVANLDSQGTYVTFGKTIEGLAVLKNIIGLHQEGGGQLGGAPSRPVTVNKVTIVES